jgi:hypothetical protein
VDSRRLFGCAVLGAWSKWLRMWRQSSTTAAMAEEEGRLKSSLRGVVSKVAMTRCAIVCACVHAVDLAQAVSLVYEPWLCVGCQR